MARRRHLSLGLAGTLAALAVAAPAWAQGEAPHLPGMGPDAVQRMYDAPLKRMYDDPLRRLYPDTSKMPGFDNAVRSLYGRNPLIPGGQSQAPRTINEPRPDAPPPPPLPPGGIDAANPAGNVPPFDAQFRRFDLNGDGAITRGEYVNSNMQRAPAVGPAAGARRESLSRRFDSRFRNADANRDRVVTRPEYDAVQGNRNPRF
jgi:hypothetical protein